MILLPELELIIDLQRKNISDQEIGLKRSALASLPDLTSHALIVSGIRRCGKSTLLFQMLKEKKSNSLYLNFEDTRLYEFERTDFSKLDKIISDKNVQVLFFDEIQIVPDWERYVRQKLDERFQVVITGSNASLLSEELGTKLTGRHILKELYPFSYDEFCLFRKVKKTEKTLTQYLEVGGFPEYVKSGADEILNQLFDDILVRDIAMRYGVRDVKTLQKLGLYLISNVGKPITGNKLKVAFEVGSTSTIMEYLSHLENAWLFHFIPKFSYSLKKQLVNPKKTYAIDTGLIHANSASFSSDKGRIFENLVYLHLRRKYRDIYYFNEEKECDFVTFEKGSLAEAVQVCYHLNNDNLDRELNGVLSALKYFDRENGTIVTLDQSDSFQKEGKTVKVIPAHEYLND